MTPLFIKFLPLPLSHLPTNDNAKTLHQGRVEIVHGDTAILDAWRRCVLFAVAQGSAVYVGSSAVMQGFVVHGTIHVAVIWLRFSPHCFDMLDLCSRVSRIEPLTAATAAADRLFV